MTVNQQKKVARGNINRYENSKDYTLYHAYNKPSIAKTSAWKEKIKYFINNIFYFIFHIKIVSSVKYLYYRRYKNSP